MRIKAKLKRVGTGHRVKREHLPSGSKIFFQDPLRWQVLRNSKRVLFSDSLIGQLLQCADGLLFAVHGVGQIIIGLNHQPGASCADAGARSSRIAKSGLIAARRLMTQERAIRDIPSRCADSFIDRPSEASTSGAVRRGAGCW